MAQMDPKVDLSKAVPIVGSKEAEAELADKAAKEIDAVLNKYGMMLLGTVTLPTQQIRVVPRPKKEASGPNGQVK
jgi:hypothetical protein